MYRAAARIAVLSPGFKSRLVGRGVPAEKIEVIYNWSDEASTASNIPAPSDDQLLAGRFNILFAGNMGRMQGLETVLEAAQSLQLTQPLAQFILMGGGVELPRLREIARARRLTNVRFCDPRSQDAANAFMRRCDTLLVHLKDDPLFRITIPSKTQAYMAAGRPLLMAVRGDAAALVKQAGCGICAEPEQPHGIAGAVSELMSMAPEQRRDMGERGALFYRRHLSMEVGVKAFERLLIGASRRTAA
jgi:glycosyltransferase involved in cell wall biosynthesis